MNLDLRVAFLIAGDELSTTTKDFLSTCDVVVFLTTSNEATNDDIVDDVKKVCGNVIVVASPIFTNDPLNLRQANTKNIFVVRTLQRSCFR